MANSSSLEEAWRRAMDLNMRYYSAVGRLATEYWRELVSTIGDLGGARAAAGAQTANAQAASQAPSSSAGTIVLEAEAGSQAIGVFLVQNHLDHRITAKVQPSAFVDESGNEAHPTFEFDPEVITLDPKEQMLVHARATIDRAMKAGESYRGELVIPDLAGTRIPVVLRRRPGKVKRGGEQ
jgi:hypothetical protein